MKPCALAALSLASWALAACSNTTGATQKLDDYEVLDAALPDAAVDPLPQDAGRPDAATPDAAVAMLPDAGVVDAGAPDGALPVVPDGDQDGLPDAWETAAAAPSLLSPSSADSDGDGTPDGQEDPDGDGLTNQEEYVAGLLTHDGNAPSPLQLDLLVELDCTVGRCLEGASIQLAAAAYAALPRSGAAGQTGVALHLFKDEGSIAPMEFSGDFGQRFAFLGAHGWTRRDVPNGFPASKLLHVIITTKRQDIPGRGGELVASAMDNLRQNGVLIYFDALTPIHPACAVPSDLARPAITLQEALGATLAHELGHALQLGHDTEAGGGINTFNIMSVPQGCGQAQERMHGAGNMDAQLGATQALKAPRFSTAAAALMEFSARVGVDTAMLFGDVGHEM